MKCLASGLIRYKSARDALRKGNLEKAFDEYVSAFLSRISDEITNELLAFFRYQFSVYLAGKGNMTVSLPEGDMITDLIMDTYHEYCKGFDTSEIAVSDQGRCNIISSCDIVFPGKNDTGSCRKAK